MSGLEGYNWGLRTILHKQILNFLAFSIHLHLLVLLTVNFLQVKSVI